MVKSAKAANTYFNHFHQKNQVIYVNFLIFVNYVQKNNVEFVRNGDKLIKF